jgi:hypothetical protein
MNCTKDQSTKNRIRSTSSSIMEQNSAAPPELPLAILPYLVLGSLPSISTRCPQGTLQHEILEGEGAAVFVNGGNLEIQVSCRANAGGLDEEVSYALVTTLEVAEEVGVMIYDEVRAHIQAQIRIAPGTYPRP